MKLPDLGSLDPRALMLRGRRRSEIDSSLPGAERTIVSKTNTALSGHQLLKAAGVSAPDTLENMIVGVISALLATFFLIAAVLRLSNLPGITGGISRWSNPTFLYLLARAAEIVGGVMLLMPRWAWLGAAGLAAMMTGAVAKNLMCIDATDTIIPSMLLALLGFVAYARWSS
jgi:uncharacterized membrane protein YphA (DoxX/SURF4 family)